MLVFSTSGGVQEPAETPVVAEMRQMPGFDRKMPEMEVPVLARV